LYEEESCVDGWNECFSLDIKCEEEEEEEEEEDRRAVYPVCISYYYWVMDIDGWNRITNPLPSPVLSSSLLSYKG